MLLKKLTDHIYVLPYESDNDRPNLYYILGTNYSVAIDAGNSKAHVEKFYAGIEELGYPLPKYTIITHWHWDHTFGMHAVKGETIANILTQKELEKVQKWQWTLEAMKQREVTGEDIAFCNDHIVVEYPDLSEIKVVLADRLIDEKTVMDLGDTTLTLIPRPSTHGEDSLFIYESRDQYLFVGDASAPDFYFNNEKYDEKKLIDMIAFLKGIDYKVHCFCHYEENTKEFFIADLERTLQEGTEVTK